MSIYLPPPRNDQPYFDVSVIEAGLLTLPDRLVISPSTPSATRQVPALVFVLKHSVSGTYVLFDLGVKKNLDDYAPLVQERLKKNFAPCEVKKDVADWLVEGGVIPRDINTIIISHVHWDHVGDSAPYTKAQFLLGGPARHIIESGYPGNPDSSYLQNTVPESRTTWLSYDEWKPVGPFERGRDCFGDGSLYLIDAAGHLEGHINALVRNSADGSWVYLAGDSAHDWRLIRGEKEIADFHDEASGVHVCMHVDKAKAADHMQRIGRLKEDPKVEVILAHDDEWYSKNKDTNCWPNKLSPK